MPELPEVEQFRRVLLPLVSTTKPLRMSLLPEKAPPRVWVAHSDIDSLGDDCYCTDVLRKGKQLCLVLEPGAKAPFGNSKRYLFLHMGMTGCISSPGVKLGWGHEDRIVADESFPPKYTYLILQTGDYKTAFCDPRKFGKSELRSDLDPFDALAPDAWQGEAGPIVEGLTQKSLGIKALLLDQKRACCGVGNWVADEVLYQCQMHPDQAFLTTEEATRLVSSLQSILAQAVECLANVIPYPTEWLFPYRWTKKKAGKDGIGRSISFVQSGGRTTAIIASQQRLYKRKRSVDKKEPESSNKTAKKSAAQASAETFTNGSGGSIQKEPVSLDDYQRKGRSRSLRSQPRSEVKQTTASGGNTSEKAATTPPSEIPRRRSPRFLSP